MALNFKIDDTANLPVAGGSIAFLAVAGTFIWALKQFDVAGAPHIWLIVYLVIAAGFFILTIGTLATRQARIRAEADRPPGHQGPKRRRTRF